MAPQVIGRFECQPCMLLQLHCSQTVFYFVHAGMLCFGESISYELREDDVVTPRNLTTAMFQKHRGFARSRAINHHHYSDSEIDCAFLVAANRSIGE